MVLGLKGIPSRTRASLNGLTAGCSSGSSVPRLPFRRAVLELVLQIGARKGVEPVRRAWAAGQSQFGSHGVDRVVPREPNQLGPPLELRRLQRRCLGRGLG